MSSRLGLTAIRRPVLAAFCLALSAMSAAMPAQAQPDEEINLKGVFDFHSHQDPDSHPRTIDADDLARIAKARGMRGMVMKNHYESTASLVYMIRKEVPGLDVFGGITLNRSVGGINLEAVKHMADTKGGWGRVIWLPTVDAENQIAHSKNKSDPFVPVTKDGHLVPEVLALIDYIAQHHQLVLETGHISAQEALLVIHTAHERGVTHIVVTHAMSPPISMSIPQMQQAAKDGAYLEFVYLETLYNRPGATMHDFAEAMRAIGPDHVVLGSDFGSPTVPSKLTGPEGMLAFMVGLHKEGLSVADINLMAKTNPMLALGLQP